MNTSSSYSRRTFLRKAAVTAGTASLAGGLLAACGGSGAGTTGDVVTVTYWDWFVSQAPWVDNEIKLFQQAHPNIKVKKVTQSVDKYPDLFALSVKGKNEPDVFAIPANPDLPTQIQNGWLKPLDELVPSSFKGRFPDGTFREGNNVFSGKLYSAPLSTGGPWAQLYIDNAVFKQAGLTGSDGNAQLPKTWDDIIRFAETIKKKSNGSVNGLYIGNKEGNELAWGFHMFSLAAGAPGGAWGVDYRKGVYTYSTDRAYQDVLEFYLELKKRGVTNSDAMTVGDELARVNFSQQKGGMLIGGVWNQSGWTTAGYTDYSLTSLIPDSGDPKAFFYKSTGGTGLAVGAQSKHAKEAATWLDWIYSKEAGKRYVQYGIDLSVFPENNVESNVSQNKTFAQYVKQTSLTRFGPDNTVRNPDVGKIKMPTFTPGVNDVVTGIWTGQIKDIKGALQQLEDKANASLEQGIKDGKAAGLKVSKDDYIFSDWDPSKDYITKVKA